MCHVTSFKTLQMCSVTSFQPLTITPGDASWHNYFLCGVKGVVEEFNGEGFAANIGLRCLVDGTVPPSAGLSSSSALVVSAAICEMT